MEEKGDKRILGRSSFSLLIENLSERFRNTVKEPTGIWKYFNTTTTKGKRNVVLLCYAIGFIGLHAVWQHSKRNKTITAENTEIVQEGEVNWSFWNQECDDWDYVRTNVQYLNHSKKDNWLRADLIASHLAVSDTKTQVCTKKTPIRHGHKVKYWLENLGKIACFIFVPLRFILSGCWIF